MYVCTLTIFFYFISGPFEEDVSIALKLQHENLALIEPTKFDINAGSVENQTITVTGLKPGHLEVTAVSQPDEEWM